MDVAASNLANAQSTHSQTDPHAALSGREAVVLHQPDGPETAAQGVSAIAILNPTRPDVRVYDPGNPDADTQGFVTYPTVDVSSR